jgi:hypothetical protein
MSVGVKFGLSATYGFPFYHPNSFPGLAKWDFNKNYFYSLGGLIEFNNKDFNRTLIFLFQPAISKTHYGSDVSWTDSYNSYRNKMEMDFVSIQLPVSIKYSFNSSAWKVWPNFSLGFNSAMIINSNAKLYSVRLIYFDHSTHESHDQYQFSPNLQRFLFASLGLDVPIKKSRVSFNINYEFCVPGNETMISLTTAYYF